LREPSEGAGLMDTHVASRIAKSHEPIDARRAEEFVNALDH
jgi:hypothetical protein